MLLGKIKLYDVAKELNLTSKEVLEIAKKLNIEAKSHLSSIDEADANKIKESVKNLTAKKPEKKMNQEKAKKEGIDIQIKEYEQAPHIWIINNINKQDELQLKAYQDLVCDIQ